MSKSANPFSRLMRRLASRLLGMPAREGAARAILLDVREANSHRGYHLMAAVTQIGARFAGCRLSALTSGNPDEAIALDVFRFDTGLDIAIWPAVPEDLTGEPCFDLFATISDDWQDDALTAAARLRSRATLTGLCFKTDRAEAKAAIDGNDTTAFAAAVLAHIEVARSR